VPERSAIRIKRGPVLGVLAVATLVATSFFGGGSAVHNANPDAEQIASLVDKDGFPTDKAHIKEHAYSNSAVVTNMRFGTCILTNVGVSLHFERGKVVDVSNYHVNVAEIVARPLNPHLADEGLDPLVVQNLAQLRQEAPGADC